MLGGGARLLSRSGHSEFSARSVALALKNRRAEEGSGEMDRIRRMAGGGTRQLIRRRMAREPLPGLEHPTLAAEERRSRASNGRKRMATGSLRLTRQLWPVARLALVPLGRILTEVRTTTAALEAV